MEIPEDTCPSCFLCLKNSWAREGDDYVSNLHSFRNLCRYLKIIPINQEGAELTANMCTRCYSVLIQFDKLYEELEIVRLKINASVKTIYMLLSKSTDKQLRNGPLMHSGYVENLREEILQKCKNRVETFSPKIKLEKFNEPQTHERTLGSVDPKQNKISSTKSAAKEIVKVARKRKSTSKNTGGLINPFNDEPRRKSILKDKSISARLKISIKSKTQIPVKAKNSRDKSWNTRKFLRCDICNKVVQYDYLNKHRMTHTGERPLSCQHCPQRFRTDYHLRRHWTTKHQTIIFGDCRKYTKSEKDFKVGIKQLFENVVRKNSPDRGWACSICSRSYALRHDAKCHMIRVHLEQLVHQLKEVLNGGCTIRKKTSTNKRPPKATTKIKKSFSTETTKITHLVVCPEQDFGCESKSKRSREVVGGMDLGDLD